MTTTKHEEPRPLRVLSLGAGVQSSALALMMKHGEVEKADLMIFADTCSEPQRVYTWLAWLVSQLAGCMPFARVQHENGLTDNLERACRGECSALSPPFFLVGAQGKKGMLWRTCTDRFKVRPIERYTKKLLAPGQRCTSVRGISIDEDRRAVASGRQWVAAEYPLVREEISREDCKRWMVRHNYPIPPRSACVYCPYRCNAEWRRMRETQPEDWAEACRVDELVRHDLPGVRGTCYVHAQRVPLRDVNLGDGSDGAGAEAGEWAGQCEGMCGV